MNKALLVAAVIITGMTALSISTVGDTVCGPVSWTAPVSIFLTLLIPAVLGYYAGHRKRLKDSLRALCLKRIGLQP